MKEREFQKFVILEYNKLPNCLCFKNETSMYSSGKPDLTVIYKGKGILIELKVGNNKLSELQRAYLENAVEKGVCCAIFRLIKKNKRLNKKELLVKIIDALNILYKSSLQNIIGFTWEM